MKFHRGISPAHTWDKAVQKAWAGLNKYMVIMQN